MSHVKDLYLVFKSTDRSGNDVYDIKQEILSTKDTKDPRFITIGELRMAQNQAISNVRWCNQHPQRVERHGTG